MRRGVLLAGAILALALLGLWTSRHAEARRKLAALEDILRSKNDNDRRLDTDFNDLSQETRKLFRRKYAELSPEQRNERGTIVYLLGRNLRTKEDWAFLREVMTEPPCLSLADCSKPASGSAEFGDEVTLAYPALVALKQAQRALQAGKAPEALALISAAKNSQTPAVARLADSLGEATASESNVRFPASAIPKNRD